MGIRLELLRQYDGLRAAPSDFETPPVAWAKAVWPHTAPPGADSYRPT